MRKLRLANPSSRPGQALELNPLILCLLIHQDLEAGSRLGVASLLGLREFAHVMAVSNQLYHRCRLDNPTVERHPRTLRRLIHGEGSIYPRSAKGQNEPAKLPQSSLRAQARARREEPGPVVREFAPQLGLSRLSLLFCMNVESQ